MVEGNEQNLLKSCWKWEDNTYTSTYTYTYTYTYKYTYTYTYGCVYAHVHMGIHVHILLNLINSSRAKLTRNVLHTTNK